MTGANSHFTLTSICANRTSAFDPMGIKESFAIKGLSDSEHLMSTKYKVVPETVISKYLGSVMRSLTGDESKSASVIPFWF